MVQRQRGFTLIEVLITVGIISIVTAGSITLAQSSRSAAVSTAALRFDTLLDAARTTAYEFDRGATIVFARDAAGDGFTARLYRNRPATGPLVATTLPLLEGRVGISETEVLGSPGFALAIHGDDSVAGIIGYTLGSNAQSETVCPASGAFHLVFAYAGSKNDRYIPCRINLAATGPIAFPSTAAATPQPSPTPFACVGVSCAPLPAIPTATATCPPGYLPKDAATCENPSLVVSPTSLTFASVNAPAQSFAVHEDIYVGAFHVSNNCGGAISETNTSGGGNGTDSSYAVFSHTANKACSISVSDDRGNAKTVAVITGNGAGLVPETVCDAVSPPRPAGADLGANPDGIHEDYSSGAVCAPAVSQPTALPTGSTGPMTTCPAEVVKAIQGVSEATVIQTGPQEPFGPYPISGEYGENTRWVASNYPGHVFFGNHDVVPIKGKDSYKCSADVNAWGFI